MKLVYNKSTKTFSEKNKIFSASSDIEFYEQKKKEQKKYYENLLKDPKFVEYKTDLEKGLKNSLDELDLLIKITKNRSEYDNEWTKIYNSYKSKVEGLIKECNDKLDDLDNKYTKSHKSICKDGGHSATEFITIKTRLK